VIRLERRHRHPGSPDDRLVPLINVIFLLLLFFMLAGNLARLYDDQLRAPDSASETLPPAALPELLLAADGSLRFEGVAVAHAELAARLGAAGAARSGVRLLADARTEFARLEPVLAALREAGVERVALVTLRRGSAGG
jgi:biopolymer transport protein ExbD